MEISIETWRKNEFEVIDYDSNNLTNSFFESNEQGYIYRNQDEIINVEYKLDKDYEKIFEILFDENSNYELKFNNYDFDDYGNIKTKNSAWFALIRNRMDDKENLNRYELREGDIIRMGRICLMLKILNYQKYENHNSLKNSINNFNQNNNKISVTSPDINNSKINFNENASTKTEIILKEIQTKSPITRKKIKIKLYNLKQKINDNNLIDDKKENFCRICYGEENQEDNPLVQPCNCQGSMKYIHLICLKHWLETNAYTLSENNTFSKTFKFKEPEARCELCKTKLPDYIRHKGKLYKIMDFGNYYHNYAIFENLTLDKNNHKYLYMISLDNTNQILSIGRGCDCSLIINDASISRNHCALRFCNKKLFIEDCGSKFGTSIFCFSEKIKLIDELQLYLQIGRSFIKCKVKKNSCLFDCCNVNEIYNFDFYYKQNKIKIEDFHKMTVKTEVDDNDNIYNEEEKNEKTIDFSEIESNALKNNKNIIKDEIPLSDLEPFISPLKLNVITECIDENNNDVNKIDNVEKKNQSINDNI